MGAGEDKAVKKHAKGESRDGATKTKTKGDRPSQWAGLLDDAVADEPVQPFRFDDIHLSSEALLEVGYQPSQVKQTAPRFHFHQKIDIAVRPGVTPSDRTEHADISCPMYFGKAQNFVSSV
jgi:hypothetical protein